MLGLKLNHVSKRGHMSVKGVPEIKKRDDGIVFYDNGKKTQGCFISSDTKDEAIRIITVTS